MLAYNPTLPALNAREGIDLVPSAIAVSFTCSVLASFSFNWFLVFSSCSISSSRCVSICDFLYAISVSICFIFLFNWMLSNSNLCASLLYTLARMLLISDKYNGIAEIPEMAAPLNPDDSVIRGAFGYADTILPIALSWYIIPRGDGIILAIWSFMVVCFEFL